MAVAGTLAIVWMTNRYDAKQRDIFEVLVVYGPLVLAGYDAAARIHRERLTGALDRVGLSGQPAWRVVVESAVAYSLPFVAVSIACAAALAVADRQNAALVLVLAGRRRCLDRLAAVRGLSRSHDRAVHVDFNKIVVAAVFGRQGTPWIPGVLAVVTAVAGAALALERASGGPANLRTIVAGAAAIAAAASAGAGTWLVWPGRGLRALAHRRPACPRPHPDLRPGDRRRRGGGGSCRRSRSNTTGYLSSSHCPTRSSTRFTPSIAYRVTQIVYAGIVALYAAAGFVFGCCAWNRCPDRRLSSLLSRAVPVIGGVILLFVLEIPRVYSALHALSGGDNYTSMGVVGPLELLVLAVLGVAAAALGWRERAATLRERTPRP